MLVIQPIVKTERNVMYVNFAARTLIVLGVLLTVLGFLAGGSVTFTLIGLGAIGFAGILGILDRHATR
ncbi:MAG: hypothetical protein LC798_16510 [Chloroflexi bacterium]|nr:hypothetical protein [Chloroflexota bacterium]